MFHSLGRLLHVQALMCGASGVAWLSREPVRHTLIPPDQCSISRYRIRVNTALVPRRCPQRVTNSKQPC